MRRLAIGALVAFFGVGLLGVVISRAREKVISARLIFGETASADRAEHVIRSRLKVLARLYGISSWRMTRTSPAEASLALRGSSEEGIRELLAALVKPGRADFHLVASDEELRSATPEAMSEAFIVAVERRSEWSLSRPGAVQLSEERHVLKARPELSVERFERVEFHTEGLWAEPVLELTFLGPDRAAFAELTARCVGRQLALVVDGSVKAAAKVKGPVIGGRVELRGLRDRAAVERLAALLEIGALPCKCEIASPLGTIE